MFLFKDILRLMLGSQVKAWRKSNLLGFQSLPAGYTPDN